MNFKLYSVIFNGNKWMMGIIENKRYIYILGFFSLMKIVLLSELVEQKLIINHIFTKFDFQTILIRVYNIIHLERLSLDKSVFFDSTQNSIHLWSVTIWNCWTLSVGFAFVGIDKCSHLNMIFKIWTYYKIK